MPHCLREKVWNCVGYTWASPQAYGYLSYLVQLTSQCSWALILSPVVEVWEGHVNIRDKKVLRKCLELKVYNQ